MTAGELEALAPATALFRGLADPNRLTILRALAEGERRVVDLVATLGLAQGTVSGHLACLRDCGLVVGRPQARQVFYSLAQPELLDLFHAADQLLAMTGRASALCATYGTPDLASQQQHDVCGDVGAGRD